MGGSSQTEPFSVETRAAFLKHIESTSQQRNARISPTEKQEIIDWLTHSGRKPSCRNEMNRRTWIRRNFTWDDEKKRLLYGAGKKKRKVISTNEIVSVVERTHKKTKHGGVTPTWIPIRKKYHGVLQVDIGFLLKRCEVCAHLPAKRAKGATQRNAQDATPDGASPEPAIKA
jgi:hypothetical protein